MELLFPSFPVLFSLLIFIFMIAKSSKKTKTPDTLTSKTPPGPWKLPIIGNIHQLAAGSLPHYTLRDLAKKYGPLMQLQLGEVSTIVISSAEMAKEVMKNHDAIFSSRPKILVSSILFYDSTDMVFSPYGAYWRQLRKICTLELLSVKRVQSFKSIREEEVSNLIKSITSLNAGFPINLTEKIFSLAYGITSRAAVGKKCKDQELLISIVKEISKAAGGFHIADLFPSIKLLHLITGMRPKLEKLHRKTDEILENIINEHKANRESIRTMNDEELEDDFVDVLIKLQEDGGIEIPLTTNNIKAVILDMLSAGSETSATAVDWVMVELLKNPKVMEKAQAEVRQVVDRKGGKVDERDFQELKYLQLVIKETLRLHSPVPLLIPRECGERCVINGYEIPEKSKVIINAWAIGRDPTYWTEPDSFVPERFLDNSINYKGADFEYIPFGAGRRICPGMMFGLVSTELPLMHFLYHFDWKLPNEMKPEDIDMTEEFGASVRRKLDMCLIPIAYAPNSSIAG